jgi:hypothetical protein
MTNVIARDNRHSRLQLPGGFRTHRLWPRRVGIPRGGRGRNGRGFWPGGSGGGSGPAQAVPYSTQLRTAAGPARACLMAGYHQE